MYSCTFTCSCLSTCITLSLAKNGYVSSSKHTKHIKAKYFFIRHFHNSGELELRYCPTESMWADVLSKPLQGAKFRLMRAFLMNCPTDYSEATPSLPIAIPSASPRLTPTPLFIKPSRVPSDIPTDNPNPVLMKHRSLRPNASSRGCVETMSHSMSCLSSAAFLSCNVSDVPLACRVSRTLFSFWYALQHCNNDNSIQTH